MLAVLKTRDYRLLWIGQGVSHLGDQFHLIALPWLVLTLTHDPLQLGLVLAVAGVPRALLMLVGGALADRRSPRTIMLVSDGLRFALAAVLAVVVLTGTVQIWMVYALTLSFGVISGFFMPAAEAALPRLLRSDQLEGGNALMMGADQLAQFVGPALAGTLIAVFATSHAGRAAGLTGVGAAFALDAVTFAVSTATLVLMRGLPALRAGAGTHPLAAVAEGLRFTLSRPAFCWMIALIAAANLLLVGPLFVGIPVLAQSRFSQGAAAFGLLLSAYGVGNLAGMIVAGSAPRPSSRGFTRVVLALFVGFGLVVTALAFVTSVWVGVALLAVLGIGNGYVAVVAITLVQRMTPTAMLGRVMSLVILAMLGSTPVSQAVAGAVVRLGPVALFVGCGMAMLALSAVAASHRRSWSLDAFESRDVMPAAAESA